MIYGTVHTTGSTMVPDAVLISVTASFVLAIFSQVKLPRMEAFSE